MNIKILSVLLMAVPIGAAAQTTKTFPVTVISQVKEANTRVTALAIDFQEPLPLNWTMASAFKIDAELGALLSYEGKTLAASAVPKAPRTILRAYTSDRPDIGAPRAGQYVIIEMDANDSNASSWYMGYNPGFRQILPYGHAMKYDIDLLHDLAYAAKDSAPDEPAAEVGTVSADAQFEITNSVIRTADAFKQAVYTQDENEHIKEISYNFYAPQSVEKAPLVIFLHGSGQSHDTTNHPGDIRADTRAPLITNQGAVTWIEKGGEPLFVLAPQAPARDLRDEAGEGGWRSEDAYSLLTGLIDTIIDENPSIDQNRIYLAGLSMGAIGSWKLLTDPNKEISGRFAAALLMNGMSTNSYALTSNDPAVKRAEAAAAMAEMSYDGLATPVWITHADTDPVVHVDGSRIPFAKLSNSNVEGDVLVPGEGVTLTKGDLQLSYVARNPRTDQEVRYTEYLYGDGATMLDLGMVTPNGHFSWEVSFKDQNIIDWMLAQTKND